MSTTALLLLPLLLSIQAPESGTPVGFDPAARLLQDGRVALAAGDLGQASQQLRRALEFAPGEGQIRLLLARTLNERGKHGEALRLLEPQSAPPPAAWEALELGRALQASGATERAQSAFRVALQSYPACGGARLELGRSQLASGNAQEARATLEPLLLAAPDEPAVLVEMARVHEARGARPEAIELLQEALPNNANNAALRLSLARLLLEAGRASEAWTTVDVLLDESMNVSAMVQVARVASAAHQPLEALAVLGAAMNANPTDPEVLHDMLELVEDSSHLIELLAQRRMEGDPDDVYAWQELLQELLARGRCEQVLELVQDASPAVLADVEIRLHEAAALRRLGRVAQARACLERLTAGDDPEAWYELGLLEYAASNDDAARAAFLRAARGDLQADAHYNRALCERRLQRHQEAADAFRSAAVARPTFVEAWLELGRECRFRLGDTDRARQAFGRYLRLGGDDLEVRRWMGVEQ